MLGLIDANTGNPQNDWDTDQFPTNIYDTLDAMMVVLRMGGIENGELSLTDLRDLAIAKGGPERTSGKQESYENLINDPIVRGAN